MGDDDMRKKFYKQLTDSVCTKKENNFYLTKERYAEILREVKEAKRVSVKQTVHYRRLRRYDILEIGGAERLIHPVSADKEQILYYTCFDELFDIIHEAHAAVGHGGRGRTTRELARKYKNVTIESVVIFLRLCEVCQKKQNTLKKGLVVKPILHREMNSRCQIDLIDMQSNPDGDMKFIMLYQDHLTKFVLIRALRHKKAEDVARQLVDIFSTFGAPNILQSDNGREFVNEVIKNLCRIWDGVKVVHGKPRHSQSQGSIERANQDVENMLTTWMESNKTTKWSEGIRFVQAMKNRANHVGIKCSPFEAMFGVPMKLGLTSLAGLREVLKDLQSEEDLEKAMNLDGDNARDDEIESNTSETENEKDLTIDVKEGKRKYKETRSTIGDAVDNNGETVDSDDRPSCSSSKSITERARQIEYFRKGAIEGLEKQAKKMRATSDKKFVKPAVGRNVTVKIPDVDRAKLDPKSLIAVVTDVKDGGFFELGTKSGKLNSVYTVNQFKLCTDNFMSVDDVPDKTVSLRAAANKLSLVGGQGFKKCNCSQKCVTNRCLCRASNMLCNSRCHKSQPCHNK